VRPDVTQRLGKVSTKLLVSFDVHPKNARRANVGGRGQKTGREVSKVTSRLPTILTFKR
jgi:hypothetical protein